MKKLYVLLLSALTLISASSMAQINITNGSSTSCSDTLYDSGGNLGDYSNSEDLEYTISPTNADSVVLFISSFDLATGDTLFIYDGANSSAALLFALDSTSTPPATVTSS